MYSKTIWVEKPVIHIPPSTPAWGGSKGKLLSQAELDKLLNERPFKPGTFATWSGVEDVREAQFLSLILVLNVQEDFDKLTYTYHTGLPKYLEILGIYKGSSHNNITGTRRWDDDSNMRTLSEEELTWVLNDADIQNHIQQTEPAWYAFRGAQVWKPVCL